MSNSGTDYRGFPESSGPVVSQRDDPAEEAVLVEILGSIDERYARWESEVRAEVTAAINRVGFDWGRPAFADELDTSDRASLIASALSEPVARSVVEGYLVHLQEHRAEFLANVLHPKAEVDGQ